MDGIAIADRFRGALLGLAAGDAIGTTVEFSAPGTFEPVTDMVGGGPFKLPAGAWTDDTSMALCLAESLLERSGFDPVDQLERYVRWYRNGHWSSTGSCFDIGNATRAALHRFERTHEPYPGDAAPNAAGNGPLMKLAPVALAFSQHPVMAVAYAADSARTTHGALEAADACRYFAGLLVGALAGASISELLHQGVFEPVPGIWDEMPLHPKVAAVASGTFHAKEPPQIRGGGYIIDALEAALWALLKTRTFEDGVLAAVNLGDDADTTAAIFGQLAGAYYGVDAIPQAWQSKLCRANEILALADGLHTLSSKIVVPGEVVPPQQSPPASPSFVDEPPPGDAYWVHEGRLLAGPYPGAPTKAEAACKLEAFLEFGVTCFLDLTEEGEGPGPRGLHPYADLLRNLAKKRGVTVTHLRLPIPDVDVPTEWMMRIILSALDTALKAGEIVYVHCWGGVGRTGTVVGCHLVELDVPNEIVLDAIVMMRKNTKRSHRISPETHAQRALIAEWSAPASAALVGDQSGLDQMDITGVVTAPGSAPVPALDDLIERLHSSPPIELFGPDPAWCLQAGEQERGSVYMEVLDPEYWQRGAPLPPDQVAVIEAFGFERQPSAWTCTLRGEDPDEVLTEAARRILAILAAWNHGPVSGVNP